jgi:hypothetical protein
VGIKPLRRWLNGERQIDKPPLPCFRGSLTVAVARDASDPLAYCEAVKRWAGATWEAYSGLHLLAHRWIDEAVALDGKQGAGTLNQADGEARSPPICRNGAAPGGWTA